MPYLILATDERSHAGDQAVRRRQAADVLQDENPPHVHLKGADFAAKVRISDGTLLAGRAPSRALRQARRWIAENRNALLEQWDEYQQ